MIFPIYICPISFVILYTDASVFGSLCLSAIGGVPDDIAGAVLDLDPRRRVDDDHGFAFAPSVGAPLNSAVEVGAQVSS